MSFVEKSGKNSWRVRYPKDDGTLGSLTGFLTKTAAQNKATEIDANRRRGTGLLGLLRRRITCGVPEVGQLC